MYTAIIADDDIIQRTIIKKLIQDNFTRIDVLSEVSTAEELIGVSNTQKPDVLLLDINFGNVDIFKFLNQLTTDPLIVFISNESKFAIDAFRYNAVDFITKPIDKSIFEDAMHKVLKKLDVEAYKKDAVKELNYLVIPSLQGYDIIYVDELSYIISEGRCTQFVTNTNQKILSYKNLSQYEAFLNKFPFFIKISRSCVINFKHVKKVIRDSGMQCELSNGEIITVSRRRTNEFKAFLNSLQ